MCRHFSVLIILVIAGLTACTDFHNRTYRYDDEIPLQPFVMKVVQTEFGVKNGRAILKISLRVANRHPEKNTLSRERFVLRVAQDREVARDRNLFESLGWDTVAFSPGEETTLVASFVVSQDDLAQRLDLLLDRSRVKGRKSPRLTLVEIKKAGAPVSLPVEGEWRVVRSARW